MVAAGALGLGGHATSAVFPALDLTTVGDSPHNDATVYHKVPRLMEGMEGHKPHGPFILRP